MDDFGPPTADAVAELIALPISEVTDAITIAQTKSVLRASTARCAHTGPILLYWGCDRSGGEQGREDGDASEQHTEGRCRRC